MIFRYRDVTSIILCAFSSLVDGFLSLILGTAVSDSPTREAPKNLRLGGFPGRSRGFRPLITFGSLAKYP